MAPFQLEWCRERVDSLLYENQQFAVTVNCDFGAPNTTATIGIYNPIKRVDSHSANVTETFAHTGDGQCAIVAPLIGIIVGQKIGHARPVFPFHLAQKIFRVAIDLTLWLPKPKQRKADEQGETEPSIKAVPKPTGHAQNLLPKREDSTPKFLVWCAIDPRERMRAIDRRREAGMKRAHLKMF